MDRLAAALARGGDELADVEIRFGGGRGTEQHGGIGLAHMRRQPIGLRVDRHGVETLFVAGANDAQRDFAAIGDEDATNRGHVTGIRPRIPVRTYRKLCTARRRC